MTTEFRFDRPGLEKIFSAKFGQAFSFARKETLKKTGRFFPFFFLKLNTFAKIFFLSKHEFPLIHYAKSVFPERVYLFI